MLRTTISVIGFVLSAITLPITAKAAEIKFLCAGALETTMRELLPQFEKSSGNTVIVSYGAAGALNNQIKKGEPVDVAIVTKAQIAALIKDGKIADHTDVGVAKVGVGVFVRKGAPKPDISSPDAFKRSLLAAKGIAFNNPTTGGPVGIYLTALLNRLGIAEQMKPKIILTTSGISGVAAALSKSVADIGFSQMIDIGPGVELVGPLPESIQKYTILWAGVVAATTKREASDALIRFITSPQARAALSGHGLQPG
jgi:molybdate transport system substrate-binding protein